jgi:hypothetical protein
MEKAAIVASTDLHHLLKSDQTLFVDGWRKYGIYFIFKW